MSSKRAADRAFDQLLAKIQAACIQLEPEYVNGCFVHRRSPLKHVTLWLTKETGKTTMLVVSFGPSTQCSEEVSGPGIALIYMANGWHLDLGINLEESPLGHDLARRLELDETHEAELIDRERAMSAADTMLDYYNSLRQ